MEVLYLSKTLFLRGKASQLAVLTFDNSPITHLVALKCGSARELVISVTLKMSVNHSQRLCPALTGGLGGNEQHPASPLGTWRRNSILFSGIFYSCRVDFIRMPKGFIVFSFLSKCCLYFELKVQSLVGLDGQDLSLMEYWRSSFHVLV